jgi:hypothetical protein
LIDGRATEKAGEVNTPDFSRAEYVEPPVIDGETGFVEGSRRARAAAFPLAMVYGVVAAVVGAVGYALIGMSGFMVSIVTIAIGWLVARAMMTATRGVGGREFQVAAVVLTYLASSCGRLIDILVSASKAGYSVSQVPTAFVAKYALFGPVLELQSSLLWGLMGLLILFYGLRTAWQLAAGSPGFGQPGGTRVGFMGLRR